MMDLSKEIKIFKIVFGVISIIVMIIGLAFSYIIAEIDDAPGIVFIGTTITIVCTSFVYGFGEIIIQLKKNNAILSDIYKELTNKK